MIIGEREYIPDIWNGSTNKETRPGDRLDAVQSLMGNKGATNISKFVRRVCTAPGYAAHKKLRVSQADLTSFFVDISLNRVDNNLINEQQGEIQKCNISVGVLNQVNPL